MIAPEENRGVGQCPEREEGWGHVWAGVLRSGDPRNPCVFCGRPGRDNVTLGETGGYFAEATAARSDLVGPVHTTMQSGTGDPKKAWPDGMPPAMAAKAAEIVADKKRRDAIARESGVGRPGQLRGPK